MIYQPDGNVVVNRRDGLFEWSPFTNGTTPGYVTVAWGNLVVVNASGIDVWDSSSPGEQDSYLEMLPANSDHIIMRIMDSNGVVWQLLEVQ